MSDRQAEFLDCPSEMSMILFRCLFLDPVFTDVDFSSIHDHSESAGCNKIRTNVDQDCKNVARGRDDRISSSWSSTPDGMNESVSGSGHGVKRRGHRKHHQ